MSFFPNNQANSNPPQGNSIFGNPSATTANKPNAFGGTGTSLFGSTSGTTTGTSLFGSTPAAGTASTSATNPTPSLFGATNTSSAAAGANPAPTSLFPNPPSATAQGGGLFGGGGSSSATSPKPASLFGTPATSTASGSTGNAFGGSNLFAAAPKPAEQAGGAAKPAPPNCTFYEPSLSAKILTANEVFNTPASSTPGVTLPPGGLFGAKPAGDAPSSGTTTAATGTGGGSSLFGGNLFAKKPETATAATPSTSTTATAAPSTFSLGGTTAKAPSPAPSTGGLFGSTAAKPDAEKKDATPAAPSINLFGAKDASTEKKDAPAAAAAPFSLFGAAKPQSGATQPASSTTGAPSAGDQSKDGKFTYVTPAATVSVPPPSMLRGKTIEEIVNKWSADLETHVREFNRFAGEVAVWDRALMENGNNLAALYSHVLAVEREQNDIDQSLDHIEQQQKDLSATLDAYERSTEEILGGQGGSLRALDTGPADTERDKNYMLATELHAHLDDLSGSLTQMIDSVNALALAPTTGPANGASNDDPMAQISQILSSHLESLQWIDGAVREVEGKVTEVEKRVKDAGGVNGVLGGSTSKPRGFGLSR
ncbi:hypothetical protein BV22DRAFT_1130143 [Leucogyrophana mollusca]|uniref:Uncharacterized protein n=1 Tax=Leucogyrophana mollusca TaxID=85980 RepID=A0ACB8BFK6_9AGAM|nr:hypothetical protein BV22DRAFT_1130143 [Leucogyrophana mollusca]